MFGEQQRAGGTGRKSSVGRMLGDEAREVRCALPYRPSEGLGHVFCRLFFEQRWDRLILADLPRIDYCLPSLVE